MKKIKVLVSAVLGSALAAYDRFTRRPGDVALANELGGMFDHGMESLIVDPTNTLPATGKYLGYMRGSTANYAKTWDGGAGAASFPLGISPDAPFQAGDFMTVARLGAIKGTQLGLSAGAITIDHLVCAAAGGLVGDANTTNATVWIIGRATKTVAGANLEVTFVPCSPYLITSNGAGVFTAATQL